MATAIEKKTVWQEPYNNQESFLRSAYFSVGHQLFCYNHRADSFRLFRNPQTGNFLVESKTTDGTAIRTNFYQHQLLGVVTYKISRRQQR